MFVRRLFLGLLTLISMAMPATGSIILPHTLKADSLAGNSRSSLYKKEVNLGAGYRRHRKNIASRRNSPPMAMAIPGYGVAEQVFVGGFTNFLQLYNIIITVRILLSWFPQAQGVGALQPIYTVTDPYLNLFRGIIPPLGGFDLSPILAFFTLNLLSSATASLGCEIPEELKKKVKNSRFSRVAARGPFMMK